MGDQPGAVSKTGKSNFLSGRSGRKTLLDDIQLLLTETDGGLNRCEQAVCFVGPDPIRFAVSKLNLDRIKAGDVIEPPVPYHPDTPPAPPGVSDTSCALYFCNSELLPDQSDTKPELDQIP